MCITSVGLCSSQKKRFCACSTSLYLYASNINFSDLSATDTELPSASSSVQLDEGSTSHVLSLYKGKKEQGTVFIEVNRFQLSRLRQIMKIYKDPHFQLTKSPDVNFYNEQCADLGGPTKEFFHDAIACFVKVDPAFNIQLFGGLRGHFIPFYGVDAVASGCFEIAGKVVAHSILHDGPGFVGLAPCLREYLATGCVDTAKELVSLDDLPDLDLKHILEAEVSNNLLFYWDCRTPRYSHFLFVTTLLLWPYSLYLFYFFAKALFIRPLYLCNLGKKSVFAACTIPLVVM